ncbi:sensor histidine kinase [Ralstonia pickettii]|jgi:signal transduction histidine kinase|uniref:sensor histidine kinase n=3 Tax=Pseudomonadota TaxID=1224 RepID=UPI000664B12D|nr:histidine kinase [Ralstonia sp. MD27]MBA9856479.1 hybrid sensor histidine kinase/response regulator [Ralstonia insidiosa]MBX3772743.1 sensor histidine kinase [Ralstonia pickettii]NOZ16780.1 sensor histidine kinase [Betaproteobacteria bacterium]MBA9869168.1 hybrid sensor histidine kinase/response regulator [Ralstonia insidiosa]
MRDRCKACAVLYRTALCFLLLACMPLPAAWAATAEGPGLLEDVSIFEDATAAMPLEAIVALPKSDHGGFVPATKARLNPGFSRSAWWVRLTLVNHDHVERPIVLALRDARVDRADFYTPRSGHWAQDAVFPPASTDANQAQPRYPVLNMTLHPGERIPVMVRVTSRKTLQLEPMAFAQEAWHAREIRAALWNFGFLGGLLALTWAALLIGFFSRSSAFYLLAGLSLNTALYEASIRGYTRAYLWPHAPEWSARSEILFVYLAIALFIAFILKIARGENVRMPVQVIYVAILCLECIGMIGAAFGDLLVFTRFCLQLSVALGILNICIALLFAKRGTPTGRLLLVTVCFALFNLLIRTVEGLDALPAALSWLKSDIYPNPVMAIIGLATHLVVLAAWIHHVGRQRTEARQRLEHWQLTEQDRLRDEVAKRTVALNEALGQAQTSMQQKIETLGYVSHDLRAPLSTINGYAKLLLDSATQSQAKLIQSIDRSIRYQLTLIDELLEYTKAELQPLGVAPSPVDLPDLLDDIAGYAIALCAQQNNQFIYRPLTPLPKTLEIDGIRLQQVLLNLLSNASKFTHNGVVTLTVEAHKQVDGYRIGLEVADTGIGIDVAKKTDIFGAYQQVQAINGGTGLGLFIAQRIVKAMRGELLVSSRPGVGTSFTFEIVAPALGHVLIDVDDLPRPAQPKTEPARPRTPTLRPPAQDLDELAQFARNGRLTDVEDWIRRFANVPGYASFLDEVQKCVDALEFAAIEALLGSAQDQADLTSVDLDRILPHRV